MCVSKHICKFDDCAILWTFLFLNLWLLSRLLAVCAQSILLGKKLFKKNQFEAF